MCKGGARPSELPPRVQRSCFARFSRVDPSASRDPVHARCVSLPTPWSRNPCRSRFSQAGRRSSSSAQGSAWRAELGERCTAAELRGGCVGLTIPGAQAGTCGSAPSYPARGRGSRTCARGPAYLAPSSW